MDFLMKWGAELALTIIGGGIIAYLKFKGSKLKARLDEYEQLSAQNAAHETEEMIEGKLEPIYEELEALRTYIRETESIEKVHMSLIIASYRFRLIQLCKQFIKQGFLTQDQYDQLLEFYRVYVGLGGNGQAKGYYDRAIALPIKQNSEK